MSTQSPPPAPGSASAAQLFEAWQHHHDRQAREQLIARFLPLARKLAARYVRSSEPFDDLVQVASVGLIKAIERYDPSHGAAFTTFAVPTILGELKRHFRDTSWTVQVDRRAQERARSVLAAQRAIMAVGRAPTVMDIAQFLECDAEEVLEGLQAALAYSPVSLDAPVESAGGDDDWSLSGRVGADDEGFDHVDERATIDAAVQHLPKLEREVLYLRFGEDLSQREIAARIGVSQMHVSRLLRRALDRLRQQLGPEVTGD